MDSDVSDTASTPNPAFIKPDQLAPYIKYEY